MEDREKQAKEIVENIEQEWATVGEKAERREAILKEETERERKGREDAEKRLEQLETVLKKWVGANYLFQAEVRPLRHSELPAILIL